MTDSPPPKSFSSARLLVRLALVGVLLLSGAALRAAENFQLNEKISEQLQKLKPLTDAKQWDAALALLNSLKPLAQADSYDIAIISDIESKLYLQKGDYGNAIPPLELALRLTDKFGYTDKHAAQETVYYLAQIYYQEATSAKSIPVQQQYFSKAASYIQRWLKASDKPDMDPTRQEATMIYASILYNQAVANPARIDIPLIKQAETVIEAALLSTVRPKETFYVLLLAAVQQEGDYARSAELLELLVKSYPSKKDYWQQLSGTYLNLALDKDEKKSREYNIRSILTIERAQALGMMKTPKDNFNLVGIYFNIGQFGRATELLHSGLKNGSIEPVQKNWELLAFSYQQVNHAFQAIDVLKEAAEHFPRSGQLDYQIAQIYYSLDKSADCYSFLQSAVAKSNLEKPGSVYSFLAYVCYELRKFEEALANVDRAIATPESANDTQLPRLREAIQEAIKERDATAVANKTT